MGVIAGIRISHADVQDILNTELGSATIDTFINHAYRMVNIVEGELGDCGGTATFDAILAFTAAHLIQCREQPISSEKIDDTTVKYLEPSKGTGLSSTRYGQAALDMDCSGLLANKSKPSATLYSITYED